VLARYLEVAAEEDPGLLNTLELSTRPDDAQSRTPRLWFVG
jgi:hypothetical protein